MDLYNQFLFGVLINSCLVLFAKRLPLLTKSGWINAAILGSILWTFLSWQGWLAVVLYFLLGSIVTKLGFAYKESKGISEGRGGKRGPENVWGSAATGTFLAICAGSTGGLTKELFLVGFAASFAAKLADTFGSEIGKRYGGNTYLITTFRKVPPGTDGGISLQGTIASVFGSLLMSFSMNILLLGNSLITFILIFICGLFSTILESFIGAILQKRIIWMSNEIVNMIQTNCAACLAILLYKMI